MPSSRSSSSRRAQGGGRTPNSEPRIQSFKGFSGINFELSNRMNGGVSVDAELDGHGDQTDLQMNYTFLQNNVAVTSNKTLEVRDDIDGIFSSEDGWSFTGPVCLIGSKLYAARSDNKLGVGNLLTRAQRGYAVPMVDTVSLHSYDGQHDDDDDYIGEHIWTSFMWYDDKLIAATQLKKDGSDNKVSGGLWVGSVDGNWNVGYMRRYHELPTPRGPVFSDLVANGSLKLSETMTQACPFRIRIAYTYVNIFGPTDLSPDLVFYASAPVTEWHAGCFLTINGLVYKDYETTIDGFKAVELYYSTDNAMEMLFLGRTELVEDLVEPGVEGQMWSYDWYGYIDATNMWLTANLIAPTENYSGGLNTTRMCNIDGRLYFWGDPENPQRLYIGGNPGNLLSISPGTGGGFVDIEPGTGQSVRHVCKYKTQSGNSIVTMLCDSPNSYHEQRFNLVENTVSISNEQSMKSWQAEQVAGAVGCKSYDGAVVCQDGLYSISRYGLALTTMTMEYNSQIRTTYVSDPIKPAFTDAVEQDVRLSNAMLLECDGIVYMAFGARSDHEGNLDNVIFCYDIDLKAWWTVTIDIDEPILNLFHIDFQGYREGIGIVTPHNIYLLPTTTAMHDKFVPATPNHRFLIESGQLSTQMPQQGWQYLSQLEFHFDYFSGNATIRVRAIDMFGRELDIVKHVDEPEEISDLTVYMRIDQRLMSYVVTMTGTARFRLTHMLARVYTYSNKVGQVWGFDDSISHRSAGSVHPTFKCYNDIRRAIFT